MKKVMIPVVGALGASVIVISGASNFVLDEQTAIPSDYSLPASAKILETNQATSAPSSPVKQESSLAPTSSSTPTPPLSVSAEIKGAIQSVPSPSSPLLQENNSASTPPLSVSAENKQTNQATPAPAAPVEQKNTPGLVKINYTLHHLSRLASNQLAVWIEDEQGSYVKTLFATSFTANGGYKKRPESLVEWRKAADWENASKDVVESVSRPEQKEGDHSIYWDGTNESGKLVQQGTYVYKIEGNIEWENRVVYSGKIVIGGSKNTTNASAAYVPEGAEKKGTLVEKVTADFLPGEKMDSAKAEVVTQTRGS